MALGLAQDRTFGDLARSCPLALLARVEWLMWAYQSELGTRLVELDPPVTFIHHPTPRAINARCGFETVALRFTFATFSEKFALPLRLREQLAHSWIQPEGHLASGCLP